MISARVIPTASVAPAAIRRSASAGSTIRVVVTSGGPSRKLAACSAIAFSGTGGGGTMPAEPRYARGRSERDADVVDP